MFDPPSRWNPERNLWLEVLYRTVEDATKGPRHVPQPADKALIMREARDYLTRPSRDLAMVCALAGVDMGAVIDRMQRHSDYTDNCERELSLKRPVGTLVYSTLAPAS